MQRYLAHLKEVRISPRKARLVADSVRGLKVESALDRLSLTTKRAAPMVAKLIRSAISNAEQTSTVDVDQLFVKSIYVNEGRTLKRYLPRAQGRATPIRKRSSHITVELQEKL